MSVKRSFLLTAGLTLAIGAYSCDDMVEGYGHPPDADGGGSVDESGGGQSVVEDAGLSAPLDLGPPGMAGRTCRRVPFGFIPRHQLGLTADISSNESGDICIARLNPDGDGNFTARAVILSDAGNRTERSPSLYSRGWPPFRSVSCSDWLVDGLNLDAVSNVPYIMIRDWKTIIPLGQCGQYGLRPDPVVLPDGRVRYISPYHCGRGSCVGYGDALTGVIELDGGVAITCLPQDKSGNGPDWVMDDDSG